MRFSRGPLSLRAKLILVTSAAIAIGLTVCAGSLAIYDRWSFSQQLNYELAIEGQVLGANSAAALEFGDRAGAEEVLGAVSANHRIDIVVLYDKHGLELARFTRKEALRRFPHGLTRDQILRVSQFTSVNAIQHQGEFLGTILLEGGEGDLAARTRTYFLVAGLMTAIAVAVAISVAIRLQQRIFGPIAKLVIGMAEITQRKDYSLRIEHEGDDEVGLLVGTFNEMLSEIQDRDNELELRVEERTKALASEVTARKSLQETQEALHEALKQANAANEAKSLFLAKMSHEIRTPMNGVLGMTEVLQGTELDDLQAQCAETIEVSARNLLDIINDVLDFSKMEAEKLKLQLEPFELEALIGDVAAILAPSAGKRSLDLSCWCSPEAPISVKGDQGRLRQILLNLVGNAVKFTEKGRVALSVLALGTADSRAKLRFEVRDTGVGIPADQHDLIFQGFMQADTSRTRRQGGTGLGLTISRQLVELMGGELSLTSELGMGSTFAFEIGLEIVTPASIRSGLAGKRLLLALSNAEFGGKLAETFHFHGVECVYVDDGSAARRLLESGSAFDFLAADVTLPAFGGTELAEIVRTGREPTLPIILISDSSNQVPASLAAKLGISAVLVKPFPAGKLIDSMAPATGKSARSRERGPLPIYGIGVPNILLVEDNEVNALVASHFLTALGCRFRVSADGKEAVDAMLSEPFDAILMDVQLPIMDGLEATRIIRSNNEPTIRDVVIVAMTANALADERVACFDAGMNDYLTKPVSQADLARMLEKWLGKPRT